MSKKLGKILVALAIILGINMAHGTSTIVVNVSGQPMVPYNLGNWTYINKPVYPMEVNASQIPTGENWTYVYNLQAGRSYHVYFHGDWIDYTPQTNKTDYDIFVYSPQGDLESLHTESAGLPEHLGTTVDSPFFVPKQSGNYSFLIKNDPKESRGDKGGTFMLIEHLKCNVWHEKFLEGKVNNEPVEDTSWAYEFMTSSGRIEVLVEVPDTLDMYEAQLYLMANPSQGMGILLNGIPLAWEPGLYGAVDGSGRYGGYRLDIEGLRRTNASASCEYFGQDMFINYTSPIVGNVSLYHLALIAENGNGTVRFMIKTDFKPPLLGIENPIDRASFEDNVAVTAYAYDEGCGVERVLLNYTIDNWKTWTLVEMSPTQEQNKYTCTIPKQPAGSTVKYKITAADTARNIAETESKYVVKDIIVVTLSLSATLLRGGESIVVGGSISKASATVTLDYVCQDLRVSRQVAASAGGIFVDEFIPKKAGVWWTVSASWPGDEKSFAASSGEKGFKVEKASTLVTCSLDMQAITIGGDVGVSGSISPRSENMKVSLKFTRPDGSAVERYTYTGSSGSFDLIYRPDSPGSWRLQASFAGDDLYLPSQSNQMLLVVNDTWINQYKWYMVVSAGAAVVVVLGALLSHRGKGEEEEEE